MMPASVEATSHPTTTVTPAIIVVFSDNIAWRAHLSTILRNYGYDVLQCSAHEGLVGGEHETTAHELTLDQLSLMVLDISSTPRAALSLLEAVRDTNEPLPVLATVSEGDYASLCLHAAALGVSAILSEPIGANHLISVVERLVEPAHAAKGSR